MATNRTDDDLVLCTSPDGWSLHAPSSTDDEIATGAAPYLVNGAGRPTSADYARAYAELERRAQVTEECVYCGCEVPAIEVPLATDDAAWSRLAGHHRKDCEWIATRGHSIQAGR